MKRIIIVALVMAITSPVFAEIPQRRVDWNNDSFTPIGQFFAGASYGVIVGADIEPRTPKEQTTGIACHLGMAGLMVMVNPGFGLTYIGISAVISGLGRVFYKSK